ncbi:MAG TPA: molybdopterin cofactor-binding domain-containing protein [Pyrinomonadaceae bacterium]|nr:molybdopterin cofactor-binding domain-containing protein [Pyrinomonadaceae bacterium]
MTDHSEMDIAEVERYELAEDPLYQFSFDRRQFLKAFSAGIALVVPLSHLLAQEPESRGESGRRFNRELPQEIGAWIHVDQDGSVVVYTGKVEFGQNIRTSLAQAVAEELHVPVSTIRLVMGDTDLTPFDMGTFGSRTTPTMAPQLRKAAAAARETLIALAAQQWQVAPDTVRIVDARFVNHDGTKSMTLADVAKGQKLVKTISPDVKTTPVDRWTVGGKSVPKVDGRDFVTGRHKYTSDMRREGMLVGAVVRPPRVDATLEGRTSGTTQPPGVQVVEDGNFLGVAALDQQTATRAAKSTAARWKTPAEQPPDNAALFDYFRKNARDGRGRPVGSVADGFAAADKTLEQTYTVAYIAHAPLEPRAAVAEWVDNKLTVWTGTQRPFGVRGELSEALHIPANRIRVIVPDTGSGYGGKHTGECAIEAARLAIATKKPVKVVWTREEEFNWAYFRPAGVIDVKTGVKNDGKITAWEFHNYNSGSAGIQLKYDIQNQNIRFHDTKSPLRQGSYRGLAATANHFARETHFDELAAMLKLDPLEFRLKNIKDERLRAVLEAAATRFGWGKSATGAGRGAGISCGFEKGGYVATCAEVSVESRTGKVKLERVVESFECGAIVNPMHLENQIEGAVVQAIGGALFEAIEFANGTILNPRFARYRLPRFSDVPPIEIVLVNRKDLPSAGAGETPIVGLAPAVGNAVFAATGKRLRSLPLAPKGLQT